jgi:hypothetical protein
MEAMPHIPRSRLGGSSTRDGRVRILVELKPVAPGWPPVDTEALWAVEVARNSYRIDNTPFFVPNLAVGDVVNATPVKRQLRMNERLTWGGQRTIRVRPKPDGLEGGLDAVFDLFAPFGVQGEGDVLHGIAALCVPNDAELAPIVGLLEQGSASGWWDYEEACVDEAWAEAAEGAV